MQRGITGTGGDLTPGPVDASRLPIPSALPLYKGKDRPTGVVERKESGTDISRLCWIVLLSWSLYPNLENSSVRRRGIPPNLARPPSPDRRSLSCPSAPPTEPATLNLHSTSSNWNKEAHLGFSSLQLVAETRAPQIPSSSAAAVSPGREASQRTTYMIRSSACHLR